MKKKTDTFSYKGWLISDNFVKRCFAAFGYNFMAGIFIWLGIVVVVAVGGLVAWIFTSLY